MPNSLAPAYDRTWGDDAASVWSLAAPAVSIVQGTQHAMGRSRKSGVLLLYHTGARAASEQGFWAGDLLSSSFADLGRIGVKKGKDFHGFVPLNSQAGSFLKDRLHPSSEPTLPALAGRPDVFEAQPAPVDTHRFPG